MVGVVPYRIVLKSFKPSVGDDERAAARSRIDQLAAIGGVMRVETGLDVTGDLSEVFSECTLIEFRDGIALERYLEDDRYREVQMAVSPLLESSSVIDIGSPAAQASSPSVPWGLLAS